MTHVPDGAPFALFGASPEEGLIAVGWLDGDAPFPTGNVSAQFVAALRELCRHGVNRTRGYHRCTLCPPSAGPGFPSPTVVPSPDGDLHVGAAEIRVQADGVRFAAPDMIIHYVLEHGYAPPPAFVDAVQSRSADDG